MAFPRFLLDKDGLNETAKILYTILLDRARLSQKNDGWTDEQGHVFIFFPIKSLAETMHKSEMSVKTALNALEKENLIARKRQGAGFPNRIYVKYPPEALNQTDRIFSVKQTENCPTDGQKTVSVTDRKLSSSNKEKNNIKRTNSESKDDAQTRTDSRERIRKKYKMDRKTTVLLYVGRLAKEKNVEELLEYQQKIQESGTILMIVGGGPYLETLRKKAAELGVTESVIFTGMVSPAEVVSYYPAGDLFVSASTSETQGLTYAEALAAGLPLLCRKDECLRAVVEEGKNGWQYRTEEEFLKDLKSWKEKEYDERRGMCSYAKQSAEIFSQKRFAGSMEQLYQRQIEEKQVEREKRLAKSRQYCILG